MESCFMKMYPHDFGDPGTFSSSVTIRLTSGVWCEVIDRHSIIAC